MPCRFANSGTVATSRSASRAILALNAASNFLRDLVISVLHRLRQSRTLHTLTFGPISRVHFSRFHQGQERDPFGPCIRREEAKFVGQHFWARGYFVSTVGRDEAVIREYIKNQEREDNRLDQMNLW